MTAAPLTKKQAMAARGLMTIVLIGLFIFMIGIYPNIIGMDRSPVVGFVQIGVWLLGLGILLLGSTMTVKVIRNGHPNSLRSEVGLRLIATGYVFAVAASFADFLGIGSHALPGISYGPLQVTGLALGVLVSLFGVILYWPGKGSKASSEEQSSAQPATT
ncbi:MAG: hypothetical protein O6949_11185 [Chloroflexi bacterium]|nr:hypothetical protein [Chloroflexota bacterium]